MKQHAWPLTLLCTCLCLTPTWAQRTSGLDDAGFDADVRVQDDLFMAVNGQWLQQTAIPSDRSNYGSFTVLADQAQAQIREIVEQAANSHPEPGTDERKVADFYQSFMDETRVASLESQPLRSGLNDISAIANIDEVVQYFGKANFLDVDTPIRLFVDQDDKNSTRYLANVFQGGTTLPDRDYYLEDDEKFVAARTALRAYITQLFELIGQDPLGIADEILKLETRLAEVQWERTKLRDADKRYNLYTIDEVAQLNEQLNWSTYLEAAQIGQISELNVATPSFFTGLDAILAETSLETWRDYLTFKYTDAYAPVLSKAVRGCSFRAA